MGGLETARRAAWAQVFQLSRRVAELEAQLATSRLQTRIGEHYEVQTIADGNSAGVFVQHRNSGRLLQFNLERDPATPDGLYGALWIADGLGPDDEPTYRPPRSIQRKNND